MTNTRVGRIPVIRILLAVAAAMALFWATSDSRAVAADASDFDPGLIISDELFFDGDALTASEIDAFIDGKNPGCAAGRVCLENYRESVTAKAATSRCGAISSASSRTAGQIIATVSRSCGISPAAILVILQKEQSLVSSTAPSSRAFAYAMGAGCPDDGGCNTPNQGLYQQVYYGASLLKGYTLPSSSNYGRYAAGAYSDILYQANRPSCGTKRVFVANQATHALYVYTPYTPNKAALDNLYGTGDSCSAYGNRNFWRLFTDWFGTTSSPAEVKIAAYWQSQGGADGWLGDPVGDSQTVSARSGGVVQRFDGGAVVWSKAHGAAGLRKAAATYYLDKKGGPAGSLGWPTSSSYVSSTSGGGIRQDFELGIVLFPNADPVPRLVNGGFLNAFVEYGGVSGGLGWPTGNRGFDSSLGVYTQKFQGGTVLHDGSRPGLVRSGLWTGALARGAVTGALGWPLENFGVTSANGGGRWQEFEGGILTGSTSEGFASVTGGLAAAYLDLGGPGGDLGWPTGSRAYDSGLRAYRQPMQHGVLVHTGSAYTIIAETLVAQVSAHGGLSPSRLWPSASPVAVGDGDYQVFDGNLLLAWEDGARPDVTGGFVSAYLDTGGPDGPLGWPTSARGRDAVTGLYVQEFDEGVILHSGTRHTWLSSTIKPAVDAEGGVTGPLGWPTATEHAIADGVTQRFESGLISIDAGGASWFTPNALVSPYAQRGGAAGSLGWPTAEAVSSTAHGGGTAQAFAGGLLSVSAEGGTQTVTGGFATAYAEYGGAGGALGWPRGSRRLDTTTGLYRQDFTEGTIFHTGSRHTWVARELLAQVAEAGGVNGSLGWPESEPSYTTTRVTQVFENGTLTAARR